MSRPLRFDGTASVASQFVHWPAEHVVKCLVYYHPDDASSLRVEQEEQLRTLWEATRASGHELLLEIIPPRDSLPAADGAISRDEAVLRTISRLYNLGFKPEWWKLAPLHPSAWDSLAELIAQRDPVCRGVVILGLNEPMEYLVKSFAGATNPVVKGFMVGRTLWADASLRWLKGELDDEGLVSDVARKFSLLVEAWGDSRAPAITSAPAPLQVTA